jgi:hypothetical protein
LATQFVLHDDAIRELAGLCRDENWALMTWDVEAGLQSPGQPVADSEATDTSDPLRPGPDAIGLDLGKIAMGLTMLVIGGD